MLGCCVHVEILRQPKFIVKKILNPPLTALESVAVVVRCAPIFGCVLAASRDGDYVVDGAG